MLSAGTTTLEAEFKDVISYELNTKLINCDEKRTTTRGNAKQEHVYIGGTENLENKAIKVLQDLIDKRVITWVFSKVHPAFFLPKPDGKRVMLVMNFTGINKIVLVVRDIFQEVTMKPKIFTKLVAVHSCP